MNCFSRSGRRLGDEGVVWDWDPPGSAAVDGVDSTPDSCYEGGPSGWSSSTGVGLYACYSSASVSGGGVAEMPFEWSVGSASEPVYGCVDEASAGAGGKSVPSAIVENAEAVASEMCAVSAEGSKGSAAAPSDGCDGSSEYRLCPP